MQHQPELFHGQDVDIGALESATRGVAKNDYSGYPKGIVSADCWTAHSPHAANWRGLDLSRGVVTLCFAETYFVSCAPFSDLAGLSPQ